MESCLDRRLNRMVNVAKGEVLVRFDKRLGEADIAQILRDTGATVLRQTEALRLFRLKLPAGITVQQFVDRQATNTNVTAVEPNFIASTMAAEPLQPDDPLYPSQWALAKIQVPGAWQVTTGRSDVVVAVLDTGIELTHPDLKNQVLPGYDFANDDADPSDDHGHGTHVAGIIAAEGNNHVGVIGVAFGCRLLPVKVMNAAGEGTYADVVEGTLFAADHGARVLNFSIGGYSWSQILDDAMEYAHGKGAVLVAAAGNDATIDPIYPAGCGSVLAVSATDQNDQIWPDSNSGSHINLSAPGMGILSTTLDDDYTMRSGTSASAALTAAAAALFLSEASDLSNTQVEQSLFQTTEDLGRTGRDAVFGYGRLALARALQQPTTKIHDLDLTRIRIERQTLAASELASVFVTVRNEGSFVESNVTLTVLLKSPTGNTAAEWQTNFAMLRPGQTAEAVFLWQPASTETRKPFVFEAEVAAVPGETDTQDNTRNLHFGSKMEDGKVSILYPEQAHEWIGYRAYQMLDDSPMKTDIADHLGLPGTQYGSCSAAAGGALILEGMYEEDAGAPDWCLTSVPDSNYMRHFWDPDIGYDAGLYFFPYPYESAVTRGQSLFDQAVSNYQAGNTGTAYWLLGRVGHLLADMAVPAHVHRDPHGGVLGVNDDEYEDWIGANPSSIAAQEGDYTDYICLDMNSSYNNSWSRYSGDSRSTYLFELFLDMAEYTDQLESDSIGGESASHSTAAELTAQECQNHAALLVPEAIRHVAGLYRLFWDTTHPPPDVTHPTASITYPTSGTVSGTIPVIASASDNVGVTRVEFCLDGVRMFTDGSSPYAWSWDTTQTGNGSYQLLVKAYDTAGNIGTSAPLTVNVNNGGDTTPPVISSLLAATTPNSATISWTTGEPANGQVEFGVSPCLPCGSASALAPSLATSHSVTLANLAPFTTYNYRVFSRDAANNLAISGSLSFSTTAAPNTAPAVALGRPNGGETWVAGTVQTVTWSAVDDVAVSSVSLYYSSDAGVNWTAIATGLANSGGFAWTVPNTPSTTARVMAVAFDGGGASGADASDANFAITTSCPAPATPVLQPISVRSDSYTVAWGVIGGATLYFLEESTTPDFANVTANATASASWFVTGKLPGTYYYRVRAQNGCGQSGNSGTQSATLVLDQGPGEITALSPADNATGQPLSVNLSWSVSHPGGEGMSYNVYVATSDTFDTFNSVNIKSVRQAGSFFNAADLPFNTRVSWGIEAIDDSGTLRRSPVFHFTTLSDSTGPTGEISINNGAATTDTYSVTLFPTASDSGSGVQRMRFSNDGTTWADWLPFGPQYPWNLADWNYGGRDGLTTYTVYAQYRDSQNNVSAAYSDTIDKVSGTQGNIILNGKFYETIQDAINAAAAPDTVYLTEGVFTVVGRPSNLRPHDSSRNVGIVLRQGVSLRGAGANKTTINFLSSYYGLVDGNNAVVEGIKLVNSSSFSSRSTVLLESSGSKIKNCTISGGYYGIWAGYNTQRPAANCEVANNLIVNNANGVWLSANAATILVVNNTVAYNTPSAGIFAGYASNTVRNNIVANNGYGIGAYALPTLTHNDVFNAGGNYSGIVSQTGINGNISADPLFVDSSTGDYRLDGGSPAIDAGTSVGIPFAGVAPDMGAFEANSSGTIRVASDRADAAFVVFGPQGTYSGSGADWSVSDLPIGTYTINFTPISNRYSPPYQSRALASGQTLAFDGTYAPDTVPPVGTLSVNFGEYATGDLLATLALDFMDAVAGLGTGAQMKFSNNGSAWSSPEPYTTIKRNWDLSSYGGTNAAGLNTVYAMVSDALGNWATVTGSIVYVPNRQVLEVPSQYATIQAAVNAASPGDIVHVAPGTYGESVTLRNGVALQGSGPGKTIFGSFSTITTASNTLLEGFGGYLYVIAESGPTLIQNNSFQASLGIDAGQSAHVLVRNNIFSGSGSGLRVHGYYAPAVTVENNTFVNNSTAVLMNNAVIGAVLDVRNCVIANCQNGIADFNSLDPSHQHAFSSFNTFWNNTSGNLSGPKVTMGAGDMVADPLFVDRPGGNFHPQPGSSSINSGKPEVSYNDPDGTSNDRGAYGGPSLNTAPLANFVATPSVGNVGTFVTLDASYSFDRETDNSRLLVRWDFDGDGNWDTLLSASKTISVQFTNLGTFNVIVEVRDSRGWTATTNKPVVVANQNPLVPTPTSIADGAQNQPILANLAWSGGDPDAFDTVTYDVYFGTTANPPLVASDLPATSFPLPVLNYNTFYFWQIAAKDNHGISTFSPVWSFLTASEPTRTIALSGNLAFGNVPVGSTAQATLTIANTGNSAMTVGNISYPAGFSGAWSGDTVGAGSSQPVTVTFTPTVATNYGGNVTVNADQTSGNNTYAISGTGVPAPATVVLNPGTLNQIYDGSPKVVTASTTPPGLALATTYNGNATPPTAAGTYTVVATVNNPNFAGSTNGTLTVTPAALTITASDRSKTYGQAVSFVGTEFTSSALPNSEAVGLVTLTSSGAVATAGVSGSPFSIVPSAATGGTFNPANYTISYQDGTLRVDLAALAVTADNKVRVHGATNPMFTGTVIGVQNSDNITANYACAATPASPAGPYEIVPTLLDPTGKLGNYSVTTNNGVLTVVSEPAIVNPTLAGSSFSLSVTTAVGLNYALEYKESLEDLLWAIAQTLSGTGGTITLTDGMATNTARFYRVRVE